MKDEDEIRRAWAFIEAFTVSGQLTASERDEWQIVVEMMSKDDFDKCRRGSRARPYDRRRFRPSTEEFWGYLEPEPSAHPDHGPTSEWRGHGYGDLSLSAREYGFAYIAKIREAQGWTKPTKEIIA